MKLQKCNASKKGALILYNGTTEFLLTKKNVKTKGAIF
jgi:hypothetical protein